MWRFWWMGRVAGAKRSVPRRQNCGPAKSFRGTLRLAPATQIQHTTRYSK
jgi:hypothetical protein